jgi:hypothetical protein
MNPNYFQQFDQGCPGGFFSLTTGPSNLVMDFMSMKFYRCCNFQAADFGSHDADAVDEGLHPGTLPLLYRSSGISGHFGGDHGLLIPVSLEFAQHAPLPLLPGNFDQGPFGTLETDQSRCPDRGAECRPGGSAGLCQIHPASG